VLTPALERPAAVLSTWFGRVVAAACAFGAGAIAIRVAARFGGVAAPAAVLAVGILPAVCVWAWRDPRVAIAVVFVTIPLPFGAGVGGLQLQPVEVAIAFAAAVVIASGLSRGTTLRMPAAAWWLVALVVWCVVATAGAAKLAMAVRGTISVTEAVVLIVIAYNVVHSLSDTRWVLGVCAGVAALVALPTLWTLPQMTIKYGGANVEGRAQGVLKGIASLQQFEVHVGPNEFGAYMSVGLFAALALAVGARTPRRRLLATLAMLPIFAALVASLSRGAWIGAFVGFVFVFAFARPSRGVVLRLAAGALVVAALALAVAPNLVTAVQDRADKLAVRGPYDRRPQMWAEAIRQMSNDPLTGSGPANYRIVAARAGLGRFTPFHAHDYFLTWGAEAGLPAVALLVAFCVAVGRAVWSHGRRRGRGSIEHAIVVAVAAAPLAFLVHGAVHYTSQHFALYAAIGILLATCDLSRGTGSPAFGLRSQAYGRRSMEIPRRPAVDASAESSDERTEHATTSGVGGSRR
jgi:O-antigen ligase